MRLPFRPIAAARLGLLASWAAIMGCSSDHDLLAQKPDAGTGDDGRSTYGNAGGNATIPRETGRSNVDAGDPEPPGPWTLTWVNGVVDEEATRVCFVPVIDGHETPPAALPLPSGDALPFGGKLVLGSLPSVDLAANDLHPYLVPKSAGLDEGATCEALLAGGAGDASSAGPLSLPIIPAGTISDRRSYLAVATGCTQPVQLAVDGGDAGDKPAASGDAVCGPGSESPNASLVLVRLSRLDIAPKLGFQVVHASAATPDAMLLFAQPLSGNTLFSSGKLGFGQIAPAQEPKLVSRIDLRANAALASVRVAAGGTPGFPTVEAPLSEILKSSGLDEKSLDEADSFTFVLFGARPGKTPSSPWNAFDAVLIPNAPSSTNGED
jgi:hypothetical protein